MPTNDHRRRQLQQVRFVAAGAVGGLVFLVGVAQVNLWLTAIGGIFFLGSLGAVLWIGLVNWLNNH